MSLATQDFSISVGDGSAIVNIEDALVRILKESEDQVADKVDEAPGIDAEDFELSCDALNYWRMLLRFREEWGTAQECQELAEWLRKRICESRDYDPEEFQLALLATQERVRVPYGLPPLQLAFNRSHSEPIELLDKELAGSRLLTTVAAIAIHLSLLEYRSYILLPVENLRELLCCRKVAITGAIRALLDHGLIKDMGAKYGQGRARRFYCTAKLDQHYRWLGSEKRGMPNKPR